MQECLAANLVIKIITGLNCRSQQQCTTRSSSSNSSTHNNNSSSYTVVMAVCHRKPLEQVGHLTSIRVVISNIKWVNLVTSTRNTTSPKQEIHYFHLVGRSRPIALGAKVTTHIRRCSLQRPQRPMPSREQVPPIRCVSHNNSCPRLSHPSSRTRTLRLQQAT